MKRLFFIWLVFIAQMVSAQEQQEYSVPLEDSDLWMGMTVKHGFMKDFYGSATIEHRRDEGFYGYKSMLFEGKVGYKVFKGFIIFSQYRYSIGKKFSKQRLSIGAAYKLKVFKRTYLSQKVKLQRDWIPQRFPTSIFRYKLKFTYGKKRWKLKPSIFTEQFFSIYYPIKAYFRNRVGLVLDCKLNKKNEVSVGFIRQNTFNLPEIPENNNILSVSYGLDI